MFTCLQWDQAPSNVPFHWPNPFGRILLEKRFCLTHLPGHVARRALSAPECDSGPHLYDHTGSQLSAYVSDRSEQHTLLSQISENLLILDRLAAWSWVWKLGFLYILKPCMLGGPALPKLACFSKQARGLYSFILIRREQTFHPPISHFGPTATEVVNDLEAQGLWISRMVSSRETWWDPRSFQLSPLATASCPCCWLISRPVTYISASLP